MGLGFVYLEYLVERGHLRRGSRILDIGSQNLLGASTEQLHGFARRFGYAGHAAALTKEAERIAYFSTPRRGERTAYLSELLDLTDVFYTSFDVAPALKTEIVDLNTASLPAHYAETFDIVLNFGTTEHIFNQYNAFNVMHDAMKPGGICFHQVPYIGWLDHGYFIYHDQFFTDLAAANAYEILDLWYCPGIPNPVRRSGADVRSQSKPLEPHSGEVGLPDAIRHYLICAVLRKTRSAPFAVGLELATSHAPVSEDMARRYAQV